jgi:hypothetical protein
MKSTIFWVVMPYNSEKAPEVSEENVTPIFRVEQ